MKIKHLLYLVLLGTALWTLSSCDDIIEPSVTNSKVYPEAPADAFQSTSYTVNFWWDQVNHALSYRLQVVSPGFASPVNLVLDTVITRNKFTFNLSPGTYQWRVLAQNGSSQTAFTAPRNITVLASSIKQQTVQLGSPVNNFITNQNTIVFQWGSLYGATGYRFEIDTNNFVNQAAVISNRLIPGQQISFTFPREQVYQWRVRAENDTAQAQWSVVNSITYDHTPPATVTLVSPTNGQTVGLPVSLQWNAVTSAARYKVYVFKNDSVSLYNQTFPLAVTTNSYTFNGGKSGDKVYWKVTSLDAAGNESQPSALRNFVLQ
ncbi:MAG: hypothetical protein JWP94_473 [Mucilaginibacter sp.]|nr:hypothetical protein [Mucilaginibacter sp.]